MQPRAERVVEGLQGFLLQVEISEIIVHEADEPNALANAMEIFKTLTAFYIGVVSGKFV